MERNRPRFVRDWAPVVSIRDGFEMRRLVATGPDSPNAGRRHTFHVKPLDTEITVREGSSDAKVVYSTFVGNYHRVPVEMPGPSTILDLGSNIGLTVAHYATLFPSARILGIEIDPDSAELAQRNVSPWADRAEVIWGAAWVRDEPVRFARVTGKEWGGFIDDSVEGVGESSVEVPGYSLGSLVERLGGSVDFVKMDLQGAEVEVLGAETSWAERVRCIRIKVFVPGRRRRTGGFGSLEACADRLEELGFRVREDEHHPSGLVAFR